VDVARRAFGNELQRSLCNPRAVALIIPEGLTVEKIETQERCKREDNEEDNQISEF
jgi:hypothetical protein